MKKTYELGELKIELLGTEHYCTVCDKFSWKCYYRHRSGNLFILRVGLRDGALVKDTALMILNRGEFKEINSVDLHKVIGGHIKTSISGTSSYSRGKITKAGWISFFSPLMLIEESDVNYNNLNVELNRDEQELLNILLDQHKLDILTKYLVALNESGYDAKYLHKLIDNMDLGVWTHLKPLLHIFVSDKTYRAGAGDARIDLDFIPMSFKANFQVWDIKFKVTKAKPEIYTLHNNATVIKLGKQRKIYIVGQGERVAVYYELPHVVYAYEQFKQHIHPTALLSPSYFDQYKEQLFNYRLGDILFIQTSNITVKEAELPEWAGKLRILQGRVVTDDKDYYVTHDNDIVAYHNEHGVLMLSPGTYRLERVQYLQAGHD
jgi:hypothetical protein